MKLHKTHIITTIKEISSDPNAGIQLDPEMIKEITVGDDSPQYVQVEIEEGKSGNNIWYDRSILESIAEQVRKNQPVGYLGHKHQQGLDKEDLLPDPQTLWMGAIVDTVAGKAVLRIKGYNPPQAKVREWIKQRLVNSVSWSGEGSLAPSKDGGYRLAQFVLESIDWSRKNKAGMKGQRLSVVTEMEGLKGGKTKVEDDERTSEDIISRLVYADVKAHNPALLKTISEMAKDEVKDETVTAVAAKEDELNEKHTKALEAVPEISLMQKIRDLLNIPADADPTAALTTLLAQLDDLGKKAIQSWFHSDILEKNIKSPEARALVGRLIPITEMEGDWRTEKGLQTIKEQLAQRFDDAMENDEAVQTVIKEMSSVRGGPKLTTRTVKEQQNDDFDDNGKRKLKGTSNLSVETVKVA